MKTTIVAASILAAGLGFAANSAFAADLTQTQQTAIRQEVDQFMKAWIAAWERLDLETAMKGEADTPDFLYADVDGNQYDKAGLRKLCVDMVAFCSAEKVITQKERIYVLASDAALYAWHGAVELIQKDGTVMRVDPYNASFLLKRIEGSWKIVLQHESALPPQPVVKPTPPSGASMKIQTP
jgi:ketosteroid isomerase-like protein